MITEQQSEEQLEAALDNLLQNPPIVEPAILTPDEEIDMRIAKAGIDQAVVDGMYALAKEHAKPITTPQQYTEAKKALSDIAKVRLKGEKVIDSIHTQIVAIWKRSNAVKQEKLAWIGGPETVLIPHIKAWEAEQARLAKEEEERVQAMKEERKTVLTELGYVFVPGPPEHKYVLDDVVIPLRDVINDDYETWNNKMLTYRSHAEEVAEKRRLAEVARLAAEEEQRAERARLEEERRILQQQKAEVRRGRLTNLGMRLEGRDWYAPYGTVAFASDQFLTGCEDQHFEDQFDFAKTGIEAAKRNREEEARQRHVNASRLEDLKAIGCEVRGDYIGVYLPVGHMSVTFKMDNLHAITDGKWEEDKAFVLGKLEKKAELEADAKRKELLLSRVNALTNAGWETIGDADLYLTTGAPNQPIQYGRDRIQAMAQDEFLALVEDGQMELERRRKATEEFQRKQEVVKERTAQLKAAGWEDNSPASGLGINFTRYVDGKALVSSRILLADNITEMSNEEFSYAIDAGRAELARRKEVELEAAREAERKRIAEEQAAAAAKEAERVAALGDVERWNEWIASLKASAPTMTSAMGKQAVNRAVKYLNDLTPGVIRDLQQ